MAELVLIRFAKSRSADARRELVKRRRTAALSALPDRDRQHEIGAISRSRFKVRVRGSGGTVDADGAMFDLDDPDMAVMSVIYEVAKAGDMAMVDSGGPTYAVLFDGGRPNTLPAEWRKPKPAVCKSALQLARMVGASTKAEKPAKKLHPKYQWSAEHASRSRGRLPGIGANPKEPVLFVQVTADEDADVPLMMRRFDRTTVLPRRKANRPVPVGGGVWPEDWQLRLPGGEVFVPWQITGYESRVNEDHLVPWNIETWLRIARAFARRTKRRTGTITGGKTFVLDDGRRFPLGKLESRQMPPDD